MRRLVIIEALDSGFVVRASGDAGKVSKSVASVDDVVSFLRWYMTRPADAEAGAITFPMLALREVAEIDEAATALVPKTDDLRPTDSTVRVARSDPPPPITLTESPIPQPEATTRRMPARWARPK